MPTTESLRDTLNYFKQQRDKKLQEAKAFELTIQQLERELGEGSSSGGEIALNLDDALPPMGDRAEVTANGKKPEIRPDEFFGQTQAEAARKYLKRIGHAVSFEELVTALQAGGCKVGGENPKKILYISLVRNTRDFVPPQPGYIGLREFYPSDGRSQKSKSARAPRKRIGKPAVRPRSAGRAKKSSPKIVAGKKDPAPRSSEARPQKAPSELSGVVRSILSDKHPHSVDEIVASVSSKLGRPVKKIGIFGVLKNREAFEQVDGGKYTLRA